MRVSVIIPTYNRADYLREALASIIGQTLPPWEVLVIDDGSIDDTIQVVEASQGPIRYFRQEHRGVACARNLGLENARGDLIAWLDSDDLWEPDFLATVVPPLVQDNSVGGVYTGLIMIDFQGNRLKTSTRVEPPQDLYEALVRGNFLATPSVVVKKACYDEVGGFDPQFHIAEDADMWLRLSKRYRMIGVPQPLARIRVHSSNTMADPSRFIAARLALTQKHFGEIREDGSMAIQARMAYGYAFRTVALKYVESGQPEKGWPYLARAAAIYPPILTRLDTYYELVLDNQPRGYRGQADLLDLPAKGEELLERLAALFAAAPPDVRARRGPAFGQANLALAMLSDQAGQWSAARRYLQRAIQCQPELLRRPSIARRLAKLLLGQRLAAQLRSATSPGEV